MLLHIVIENLSFMVLKISTNDSSNMNVCVVMGHDFIDNDKQMKEEADLEPAMLEHGVWNIEALWLCLYKSLNMGKVTTVNKLAWRSARTRIVA